MSFLEMKYANQLQRQLEKLDFKLYPLFYCIKHSSLNFNKVGTSLRKGSLEIAC